ncbi:MAG TPA: endonuclease MutS2, partial [Verrucomicrobiae bacterium]|nr:endonuclease MutS2 [Verrucomicrobiae bacterium]
MIAQETLQALDYRKILERIAGFAHSDATREEILRLAPLGSLDDIRRRSGRIEELRTLSRLGVGVRLSPFQDIRPLLELLRPEGGMADPAELTLLPPFLRILHDLSRRLAPRTDIPLLKEAGEVRSFPDLLDELEVTLDAEGNILDAASPLLFELRSRKRTMVSRIRRRLEEIVREKQVAIFLQDDFITQRGGRWVIPVRMDSKGMVSGVVHDVSNSGETAFMEPLEIIPLANELENLAAEEKGEMIRIVREICRMVRRDADLIEEQFRLLVHIDLLHSVALLGDLLHAEVPVVSDTPELAVVQGRHPLLLLLAAGRSEPVVPLDLVMRQEEGVMVITGPNAGGKTIALKTSGLLLLMALSGFPVPASSTSVFPLASQLLVDIGDEQSIEQSLSTFSAHVSNMSGILRSADTRSLV